MPKKKCPKRQRIGSEKMHQSRRPLLGWMELLTQSVSVHSLALSSHIIKGSEVKFFTVSPSDRLYK